MNTTRLARSGIRSSLKKNLMPSASVWRMPNGPARFGPMRFCMSLTSLRSNQIISIVATSSSTKTMTTLPITISTTDRSIGPIRSGSSAKNMVRPSPSRRARR